MLILLFEVIAGNCENYKCLAISVHDMPHANRWKSGALGNFYPKVKCGKHPLFEIG